MRGTRPRVATIVLACLAIATAGVAGGSAPLVSSSSRVGAGGSTGGGSSVASDQPVSTVIPVISTMTVAPLRRIVPPDVLVVAGAPVDAALLRKVARIEGVRDAISFDAGSVRLGGRPLDVFAVQPSRFRAWTPPPTAGEDELWTALARDEFVVSLDARRARHLTPGASYRIEGRGSLRVRLGAVASLGMPGVDALVNDRIGERLGLVRDIGVLVNAPGADIDELADALRRLLGAKTQVISLREHDASEPSAAAPRGRPRSYLDLYKQAAARCRGLSWTVLAAIGQIESAHGRNNGPSSAGALGPMQFMPATWKTYGLDGDGDGRAEIMNPYDAVHSAAGYLCANGAGRGGDSRSSAIWRYNHASWYVQDVLSLARAYARTYG